MHLSIIRSLILPVLIFITILCYTRRMMNSMNTRRLTHAAIIAALYAAITFALQPISFGAVQFRISEAFTILPMLFIEAVPGLFAGCLIANILCGAAIYDIILGSIATLIAAMLTRKLRNNFWLAALMPVVVNSLIVGPVVYMEYLHMPGTPIDIFELASCMGSVGAGEAVVVYVLGFLLLEALRRIQWKG